jgi:hypothetical protein
MFRKPAFWIALAAFAIASAVLAVRLFPLAFPIVQIDLTMDREGALEAARVLAARDGVGPRTYREAASFVSDAQAQTFVELEGGGKEAFARMLRERLYEAHTWRVRHFVEGQKYEALIRFRPDGRPYGFIEQIEETAPGAALDADAARTIAEQNAARTWLVDLQPFSLVEQSREQRSSGRIDYTFTYERAAPTLNEGRYRLRLEVTGDRLTEVTHFIKIPEAFSRRYEEMRSANEAIGAGGSMAMVVLYVIGGIGVGLFWLLRHRWVIARSAVKWGIAVAALQLAANVNEFPLSWMSYDTAIPRASFISQQVTTFITAFAGYATLFAFSFMAAESLSRRAFGHHPQLWRIWSRDAAASTAVLGRTAGGYLLVSVFFAYDVVLYFYATRWWNWWTPSEALIHPDILATYLPWLSAIANSLQAGFWEEALFRAVPIAGAALIGDRFGRRRLFIVIAFIVQTVVFGSGHAPYPTQPSYARPVELILPSIGFGLIFLRFGLLPGIVLHYAFDVVWMAMPLFVSTASGVWIDRTMVILLTLVPLGIVLGARLRAGRWVALPDEQRNAAWVPPPARAPQITEPEPTVLLPVTKRRLIVWSAAGGAALVGWLVAQPFRAQVETPAVSRSDAARIAREALAVRGVTLGAEWRVMPLIEDGLVEAHRFVWDAGGRERFDELLGRYLSTPRWNVRIATFAGDVANRAEEWAVLVNSRGEAERVAHQLPESKPGASLDEGAARTVATAAVERVLHLPATALREVSAQPAKLSARTDWLFTFQDVAVAPIVWRPGSGSASADADARGEARIEVVIAGDEVARVRPFVRVPESWQRQRRARQTFAQIVGLIATLLAGSALVSLGMAGIISWSRRRDFTRRVMVIMFTAFAVTSLISSVNTIPSLIARLSTSQPFGLQLAMIFGIGLVGLLLTGAMIALAAGTLPYDMRDRRTLTTTQRWILGVSLGALAAGATALLRAGEPAWPDVDALGTYVPMVARLVDGIPALLLRSITLLALLTAIEDFSDGWTKRRPLYGLLLIAAGALLGAPADDLSFAEWLPIGVSVGVALLLAFVFVLRDDLSLVPIAIATTIALAQLRNALLAGTPAAPFGSFIGALLTLWAGWWMVGLLRGARSATGDVSPDAASSSPASESESTRSSLA